MGVNISGKGVLSGLASLVVGTINSFNLLVERVLGYTLVPISGYSYYTSTVGSSATGFVRIASDPMSPAKLQSSVDGITWTDAVGPGAELGLWTDVAYGNGMFVATSRLHNSLAVSNDGVNFRKVDPREGAAGYTLRTGAYLGFDFIEYSEDGDFWLLASKGGTYGEDPYFAYTTIDFNGTSVGGQSTNPDLEIWNIIYPYNLPYTSPFILNRIKAVGGRIVGLYKDSNIIVGFKRFDSNGASTSTINVGPTGVNYTDIAVNRWAAFLVGKDANNNNRYETIDFEGSRTGETAAGAVEKIFTIPTQWNTYRSDNNIAPPLATISSFGDKFVGTFSGESTNIWTANYTYDGASTQISNNLVFWKHVGMLGDKVFAFDGVSSNTAVLNPDGSYDAVASSYPVTGLATGTVNTLKEVQIAIGGQGGDGTAEVLAPVDVYTVTPASVATINKIEVTNLNSAPVTYDLGKLSAGQQLTQENSLKWDQPVSGNAKDTITSTINMVGGDRITVLPSTVNTVNVKVYGTEALLSRFYTGKDPWGGVNAYSADGNTWTVLNMSDQLYSVAYGNNKFVGLARRPGSSIVIYNSINGIDWQEKLVTGLSYLYKVIYENNQFIVYGPRIIGTSTDGESFTINGSDEFSNGFSVYNNGTSVWTLNDSPTALAVSQGTTGSYTNVSLDVPGLRPEGLFAANNKFFVLLRKTNLNDTQSNKLGVSSDGINWTLIDSEGYSNIQYVDGKYFGTRFEAYDGMSMTYVDYSTNGINWTSVTVPSKFLSYIYKFNNKLISSYGTGIMYSNDGGASWVDNGSFPQNLFFNPTGMQIDNKIVFIGNDNNVVVSSDGTNWTVVDTQLDLKTPVGSIIFPTV